MRHEIVSLKPSRKPLYCPSCLEKVDRRLDRFTLPYCSIVCGTLGRQGLGWRMNPYRIVDLVTSAVLTTGPEFDLTAKGIEELKRKAERIQERMAAGASVVPSNADVARSGEFQHAANE